MSHQYHVTFITANSKVHAIDAMHLDSARAAYEMFKANDLPCTLWDGLTKLEAWNPYSLSKFVENMSGVLA